MQATTPTPRVSGGRNRAVLAYLVSAPAPRMAHHGKIECFQKEGNILEYLERLEQVFIANDLPRLEENNAKRKALLLSHLSADVYSTLRDLCSPVAPSSKTFDQITDILKARYEEKRLCIAERFRFHTAMQANNETVVEFASRLQKLASTCNFGQVLNDSLRDRFVCGIRNTHIQRTLLAKEHTWEEALKEAQASELAEKDLVLLNQAASKDVNLVSKKANGHVFHKKRGKKPVTNDSSSCWRCGRQHEPSHCWFKDQECHNCNATGHAKWKCTKPVKEESTKGKDSSKGNTKKYGKGKGTNFVDLPNDDAVSMFSLFEDQEKDHYVVQLEVGGKPLDFIVDTGASLSIIHEDVYNCQLRDTYCLKKSSVSLHGYSGEEIPVVGQIEVPVQYKKQSVASLPLIVAKGKPVSLLGRNWLRYIRLDWTEAFEVSHVITVNELCDKFEDLFDDKINGVMNKFKADITVKENSKPIFRKPRPVPFALRPKVEEELDRLLVQGIVKKVEHSDWAAPIVVVPKNRGSSVRICGDYKVTVNQVIIPDPYPLPTTEDLFATLAGGAWFSIIDLSSAYFQLELSESSKKYLVINTHKGLFEYQRLSFGVSSAPSIFQKTMEQILDGIPGVCVYIDDILVAAPSKECHLKLLATVFTRLSKYNVKVNKEKCQFLKKSVTYLGHVIDRKGIRPTEEKVEAILNAPRPTCVKELRALLGLVNFYHKFLPNLSTVLAPLYNLLKAGTKFNWSQSCEKAWLQCKDLLVENKVLAHYDPSKPITVSCDASPYGIGVVMSIVLDNGDERPCAYASRTLTASEKNYSQIEKEGLAIIYAIAKFHKYLYGRKFTLITDHRPLTTIFGPKKGIPVVTALRLQRWAVLLMAYDYNIQYRESKYHGNADGLSRLPVNDGCTLATEGEVNYFSNCDILPVSAKEIANATRKDPILSKVHQYVLSGWPDKLSPAYNDYACKKNELSVDQGCVLWGMRVIIPFKLRNALLKELHTSHPGMRRMKELARNYLWFPNLDKEIETLVSSCEACQMVKNEPVKSPTIPWKYPEMPMERVHIDYAEYRGKHYLVFIDAFSKWPEVIPMNQKTTSEATIAVLRTIFARYGLPCELVSDNGPQFSSEEFATFMTRNGIKHQLSPPYHPASNGAAERLVQTFKQTFEKQFKSEGKVDLDEFLLSYRSTPHRMTGSPPAVLFMKRELRTRLSLIRPDLKKSVEDKQWKEMRKSTNEIRSFVKDDLVLIRNKVGSEKWIKGCVLKRVGLLKYKVCLDNGRVRHVHINHLLPFTIGQSVSSPNVRVDSVSSPNVTVDSVTSPSVNIDSVASPNVRVDPVPSPKVSVDPVMRCDENVVSDPGVFSDTETIVDRSSSPVSVSVQERRYPLRVRKPRKVLDL